MTKDQAIEVLLAHAKRCPEPAPHSHGYPEDVRDDYNERRAKVTEAVVVLSVPVVVPLSTDPLSPTKLHPYDLSSVDLTELFALDEPAKVVSQGTGKMDMLGRALETPFDTEVLASDCNPARKDPPSPKDPSPPKDAPPPGGYNPKV